MKKRENWLWSGIKSVMLYLCQVTGIAVAVLLGCKWIGRLLEMMCDYVNVGLGVFLIFAVAAAFIYIDRRDSVEEAQQQKKRYCKGR